MSKQIIRLTESDIYRIIRESVTRIVNGQEKHYKDMQNYEHSTSGEGGELSPRKRGYSPKASRNSYPGKEGRKTDYNEKVDTDRDYLPSRNKMAMKNNKSGKWDLNKSINHKQRTGKTE